MSNFIEEIKDDVFADNLLKFWQKFKWYIYISMILLLISAGTIIYMRNKDLEKQYDSSTKFFIASNLSDKEKAVEMFDSIYKDGSKGYAAMAGLYKANILTELGKNNESIATYKEIAENNKFDEIFRDLARLLYGINNETIDPATTKKNMDIIADKEKGAFKAFAMEWQAMDLLNHSKKEEANILLSLLVNNSETPPNIKNRARVLLEKNLSLNNSEEKDDDNENN